MSEQLVRNLEKLTRPIIFNGLKSRTCSPTDMDWLLEYYGKFLLIGEVKELGKDITVGQSITTTRICDAWNKIPGNIGIVIFSQHNPEDKLIMLADSIINKVYISGKWVDMLKKNITVKEFLNKFADKYNISHMKGLN